MESEFYLQARREWDERYGDLVLGKRNRQIASYRGKTSCRIRTRENADCTASNSFGCLMNGPKRRSKRFQSIYAWRARNIYPSRAY